ncbi:hypothetical protein [Bacillus solimangrovi]|uniref:Uncharacterized protein n=1 Tax=Bacillus solimangrovi TaxID=1305675 RepID=A0A1E5LAJ1_9BACI|nr:hypothetical protein [Bacillus solimangrovi]OEH91101.1 hypothetical protein BFG57_06945 [Bacillus solimangrovi]
MSNVKESQPKWFWKSIFIYMAFEWIYLFIFMFLTDSSEALATSVFYTTVAFFPVFFTLMLFFLIKKKYKITIDTIFYLFAPLLSYLPFWTILGSFL